MLTETKPLMRLLSGDRRVVGSSTTRGAKLIKHLQVSNSPRPQLSRSAVVTFVETPTEFATTLAPRDTGAVSCQGNLAAIRRRDREYALEMADSFLISDLREFHSRKVK